MEDVSEMTDLAMWSLIIGAVVPPLVSLIKRKRWSDSAKSLLSFIIFAIAGAGTAYFSDNFNGRSIVSSFLLIAVTGYALYQSFYKPTGIDNAVSSATETNKRK